MSRSLLLVNRAVRTPSSGAGMAAPGLRFGPVLIRQVLPLTPMPDPNSTLWEGVTHRMTTLVQTEVFLRTALSFAFVNLRPVLPGAVSPPSRLERERE